MSAIAWRAWQPVYPLLWMSGVRFYTSFIIVSVTQLLDSRPLFTSIDLEIYVLKRIKYFIVETWSLLHLSSILYRFVRMILNSIESIRHSAGQCVRYGFVVF